MPQIRWPFGLEVRQDVGPALFVLDIVGEPPLAPFADHDDFRVRPFEDILDHGQRAVPVGGRQGRIHQKHPFVQSLYSHLYL